MAELASAMLNRIGSGESYSFFCSEAGGPVHVEFSILIMNIRDIIELSQVNS